MREQEGRVARNRYFRWATVGILALLAAVTVSYFAFFYETGQSQPAKDRQRVYDLGYEFIDAMGRGDRDQVNELSCKNGIFADGDGAMFELFRGITAREVAEIMVAERPSIKTTIYYDFPDITLNDGRTIPGKQASDVFEFKYEEGDWCVA